MNFRKPVCCAHITYKMIYIKNSPIKIDFIIYTNSTTPPSIVLIASGSFQLYPLCIWIKRTSKRIFWIEFWPIIYGHWATIKIYKCIRIMYNKTFPSFVCFISCWCFQLCPIVKYTSIIYLMCKIYSLRKFSTGYVKIFTI